MDTGVEHSETMENHRKRAEIEEALENVPNSELLEWIKTLGRITQVHSERHCDIQIHGLGLRG